ncbi:MAG: hypothetical protein JSV33_09295 [bacterium]|nr:MAG: hypothetical protein JSV33_09295 [bacterium]
MAEGTYKPTDDDNGAATFLLRDSLAIYGGFDGTEVVLDERDWTTNVTILSGDIGILDDNSDNCYHVVSSIDSDSTAVLDGFTIVGGNATVSGYMFSGGGILSRNGSPTISNVIISGNSAQQGGGMRVVQGGPYLFNVYFIGNSATGEGGGLYVSDMTGTITNALFSGNSAEYGGGMGIGTSTVTVANVTFSDNSATSGGGLYSHLWSTLTLVNAIFWGNTATVSGDEIHRYDSTPVISYSLIEGCGGSGGGWEGSLGTDGGNNIDADPQFVDAPGGDYHLTAGSPAIDAGNNGVPDLPTTDIEGNPRIDNGTIDMGAYESIRCPGRIYVDKDVSGGAGDGTSWLDAYSELSEALASISSCVGSTQVWVAEGTYKPTSDTIRTATFQLRDSLAIYGGFTGGETQLSQRDWRANETILSGDIGVLEDDTDNSYHVVTGSYADQTAVLDGFTITEGYADGAGGDGRGGGMYIVTGSPTLRNILFTDNYADAGGGVSSETGSAPTLLNVIFSENSVSFNGGGVYTDGSTLVLTNGVFINNTGDKDGGGLYVYSSSNVALTNVTLTGNVAVRYGGGMKIDGSSTAVIDNSIFWGNSASVMGGPEVSGNTSTFSYSLVAGSGGSAKWNSALGIDGGNNIDADPLFLDAPDGNVRLLPGSPAINAGDNSAPNLPGEDLDGNPRIAFGTVDMGPYEWDNCPSGTVLYVDADANSGGSGDSWENAYDELRDALVAAALHCSNVTEIWVAEGTYMPTNDTTRAATFELQDSLAIYGGFDGTETFLSERNWVTNITILSGDIGVPADSSDNSYHVVEANDCDSTAVLDGFTITAGCADGASGNDDGGGIIASNGGPTLANLIISNNYALDAGGGMYNASAASRLSNVTFEGNEADDGGGMSIRYAGSDGARLVEVRFVDNAAATSGGGLRVTTTSPMLENVTFTGNQAPWGGGIRTTYGASPTITNALFLNNTGLGGGGGGICSSQDGIPVLTNVTFHGNSSDVGGGIAAYTGSPVLVNIIMWGDSAVTSGDEIYNYDGASTNISYSLIEGCGGSGGGWDASVGTDGGNNIDADPLFVSEFLQDFRLRDDSPAVDAGDSTAAGLPDIDINGNPRIQGLTVDMGAYEGGVVINYEYALIDSIMDVPDDQGGWVYIRFNRSMYDDTLETQYPIERYDIHRRIDNPLLAAEIIEHGEQLSGEVLATLPDGKSVKLSARSGDEVSCCIRYNDMYYFLNSEQSLAAPPGLWADIGTVSASQQAQYIALAPTLGDSISEPPQWSVYYISAHSTTPAVYFDSPVDSGYSVDNIAPGVPLGFAVAYNTGSGNQLTWDPSPEPDFQYYRVYRGDTEEFIPAPGNLVHETATENWSDPEYDGWDVHYKITALDYVGNESDAASPESVTGDDTPSVPTAFALYQNVPNPFNPTTTIRFDLPRAVHVKLCVYNVKGELIATLVNQHMPEGCKEVTWSAKDNRGRAVSSGIYFYRLVAGDFVQTRKMVHLR